MFLNILQKIKPYLLILFLLSSLSVTLIKASRAEDYSVTCGPTGCSSPGGPIFNEQNLAPTNTVTKQIKIVNNYSEDRNFALEIKSSNFIDSTPSMADVLSIEIWENGGSKIYGPKSINQLKNDAYVILGNKIPHSQFKLYDFIITMANVGNDYQSKQTRFDLSLGFEALENSQNEDEGGTGGQCSDLSGDLVLSAIPRNNQADLSWNSISGVDHYGIVYGVTPGNPIYGAYNIGSGNSYTVQSLSSNQTYYFQVIAFNSCSSINSNEVAVIPQGEVLPQVPAQGFETIETGGQVQGESTSSAILTTQGAVAGDSDNFCQDKKTLWWLPLIFQILFSIWFLIRAKKPSYLKLILISVLSQLAHQLLPCNCATDKLCNYYFTLNLIILLIFVLLYRSKRS
jgi:hypothetical protein